MLNDSTNKKTNSTNSAKLKKKKLNLELDESGWRSYILAFYSSKKKSQLSFIKDSNLKRKPFRTRWDKSGMKALQTSGTTSADAEKQYDSWFRQWKDGYTESRATNRSTFFQGAFVIHNDNDDDADDDKKKTMITKTIMTDVTMHHYHNQYHRHRRRRRQRRRQRQHHCHHHHHHQ